MKMLRHVRYVVWLCMGVFQSANSLPSSSVQWQFVADNSIVEMLPVFGGKGGKKDLCMAIGSKDNTVYLIKANGQAPGEVVWNVGMRGALTMMKVLYHEARAFILAGDESNSIYLLSATDGAVEWMYTAGGAPLHTHVVFDKKGKTDKFIVTYQTDTMICFNGFTADSNLSKTLKPLWRYNLKTVMQTVGKEIYGKIVPVVKDTHFTSKYQRVNLIQTLSSQSPQAKETFGLSVIGNSNSIQCISIPSTSLEPNLLWLFLTTRTVNTIRSTPDIDKDGVSDLIASCLPDSVYLLSGKTGTPLWGFDTDDRITCIDIAEASGEDVLKVLIGDEGGRVYCVSGIKAGEFPTVEWVFDLRDFNGISLVSTYPDIVESNKPGFIVGSTNNRVYVLDNTGKKVWSATTGGTIVTAMTMPDLNNETKSTFAVGDDGGAITVFKTVSVDNSAAKKVLKK